MKKIKVEVTVNADIKKVWEHWNNTESIKGWAFASDSWECPYAENDLKKGGRFLTRMSAKDGSETFDFTGIYTDVVEYKNIKYLMDKADGENQHRECEIIFTDLGDGTTKIEEEFYPEEINSEEMQKGGWTSILENFKKFVSNN
ncbi:MAG: SRPBCC domain-containing protein [Candidatus Pacebacteria bacterium]|nr:SRPBCC domain-containing protein [Candidatus Paceibacterota bacterium]